MSLFSQGLTPRLRPISSRKSATLSVLDVGTTKVVCLIAELMPMESGERLKGRTHLARVIGIGHTRSMGLKGGAIVDLDAAEKAVRQAIDAAERMAKVEVRSVIVSQTGGRLGSQSFAASVDLRGAAGDHDVKRVLAAAASHSVRPGRAVLHALPTGYALDGQPGVTDPRGLMGRQLAVDMHVVTAEGAASRNLMLAVERCSLEVEAVVATPYASGLAALVDDEAEMGVVLVDMGGGTTSIGVFAHSRLMHVDGVAVGGHHITMDLARGLSTKVSAAERLKTLYGATAATASDERELISVPSVDDDRDSGQHLPRSHLARIIRPRVEEILELVRDRLKAAGFAGEAGRRVVLTGGACQLTGLQDLAREVLGGQVRIGRPLGIKGLPEAAKGPPFAGAVGLLIYPQVAHIEHFEPRSSGRYLATGTDGGYLSRVGRWLRESF